MRLSNALPHVTNLLAEGFPELTRLSHEAGIPGINTTMHEPLDRDQVRSIVEAAEQGEALSMQDIDQFLETNFEEFKQERFSWLGRVPKGLIISSAVAEIAVETDSHHRLPSLGMINHLADTSLDVASRILTLGVASAGDSMVVSHVPQVLLAAGFAAGAAGIKQHISEMRDPEKLLERARAMQPRVTEAVGSGTQNYQLHEDATVAFVGHGVVLPKILHDDEDSPYDEVLQITFDPKQVRGPKVTLPEGRGRRSTNEALQRADITRAARILIFPVKAEHEFLPGIYQEDYDMHPDRVRGYLQAVDEMCDSPKPVMIVGSKRQCKETQEGGKDTQEAPVNEQCLEEIMEAYGKERGREIYIVDPTEIIIERIKDLADGDEIVYAGTKESYKLYRDRLFEALGDYQPRPGARKRRVRYNISDRSTEADADEEDIVIVRDPYREITLNHDRTPEQQERVLIIAKEVLRHIEPFLQEV